MSEYSIESHYRREYRVGPEWIVYKEFYANGPTLFVWVAERKSWNHPHVREEFPRKRDAIAWIKTKVA